MKILIFSLVYYPRFVGGAEVAVKEITDRIPREAVAFDMVTLRSRGEQPVEKIGSITIYRTRMPFLPFAFQKLFFPFVACCKARRLHGTNRYDAIWSIMANRAGFAALFFKWKFPHVPFLLTLQEGDDMNYSLRRMGLLMPILYPLWRRIFRTADKIQTISHFLADWARYQGAKATIDVVPNGVDVAKFQIPNSKFQTTANDQKKEIRKKLGIPTEGKIVITTSRLVPKNGVGDLIAAMQSLPEHVRLLVLGTGVLQNSLKYKVESLKLEKRIIFLGYISHDELPSYLHASDVFCRPSLSEGLGNSFLEAMAAGLPVVATPVGGIPDFLQDLSTRDVAAVTGLFCKVGDPKDIAEKIQLLLTNDELRNRIISNASKMVREKYEWDFIAGKMKIVFTTRH